MNRSVSKSSSPASTAIWENVRKVSQNTPEWVRAAVDDAARKSAEKIACSNAEASPDDEEE